MRLLAFWTAPDAAMSPRTLVSRVSLVTVVSSRRTSARGGLVLTSTSVSAANTLGAPQAAIVVASNTPLHRDLRMTLSPLCVGPRKAGKRTDARPLPPASRHAL